jgi:hypothetical protein
MRGFARAVWRRLTAFVGPYRCGSCDKPLRRLESIDLSPEAARAYRLAGTLGGLLAAGYVCDDCTRPGGWVLIE